MTDCKVKSCLWNDNELLNCMTNPYIKLERWLDKDGYEFQRAVCQTRDS